MTSGGRRVRPALLVGLLVAVVLLAGTAWAAQPRSPGRTWSSSRPDLDAIAAAQLARADTSESNILALVVDARMRLGATETEVAPLLDRLLGMRNANGTWGLSHPADAYHDGTTNPATTGYSYTSGLVGLAFHDAGVRYRRADWERVAVAAADAVVATMCCNSFGVWYSDSPNDQRASLETPNASALAAALFTATGTHAEIAERTFGYMASTQSDDGNWPYVTSLPNPNPLGHLALIVEALRWSDDPAVVERATAAVEREANRTAALLLEGRVGSGTLGEEVARLAAAVVTLREAGVDVRLLQSVLVRFVDEGTGVAPAYAAMALGTWG